MNWNEFKVKWIEALRSGNYPQDKGQLRSDEGYCCLGVAADLLVREGIGSWKSNECKGIYDYWTPEDMDFRNGGLTGSVPEPLNSWLMDDPSGADWPGMRENTLVSFNDKLGWDFNKIADWVEKEL